MVMMGNPDNSPPARPSTVPEDARWDPKDPGFEWIVGGVDAEGRRHGLYRSWTRDGRLHGECSYEHGKVHGKNINFHPDGTIASEAEWSHGTIMNSAFHRCASPSPEPFAQAAANVWTARYFTRDGKTNYAIRYFLRDGTECGPDGKPLPPRPPSVSSDARWFPDMDRWVDGEIERGTNKQVGRWRWWSRGGVLRHEELRDATGDALTIADYEVDGTLTKTTKRSADATERDYYYEGKLSSRHREDDKGRQIYKASWQRDGELADEREVTYDGDAIASVTERGPGGVLRLRARREGRELACALYQADGKTFAATGMHTGEKLTGPWRLFDASGGVRREVEVDVRHGLKSEGLWQKLGEALFQKEPRESVPQLAGVDAEPWATTHGCYDEAVKAFPELLRGLASADPLVRMYCLGAIEAEIEHQGSTYPATARVVPYLARLLSHPNADRAALLSTIQVAAESAAHDDDAATARAVMIAWPDVFAVFDKASLDEKRLVLGLAPFVPAAAKDVLAIARKDPDPQMRAAAIDSFTANDDYVVADAMTCLSDKDALVRAATAIAIAMSKGPATPREVVAVLREMILGWRDVAPRFAALPFVDAHLLAYLAHAAGTVGGPDARSLAQHLCERLDEVDAHSAVTYVDGLLALAFGEGKRPFAKRFLEILETVAASKQLWPGEDARDVLARWKLPRSSAELRALVAALKAAPDPEAMMHAHLHAGDGLDHADPSDDED